MTMIRPMQLAAVALLLCAGAATADTAWQTISLDGNPDFTMDIPASATNYRPSAEDAAQGTLLNFATVVDNEGILACGLSRTRNATPAEAANFRAMLKSSRRDFMCKDSHLENVQIGESDTASIDGLPGGECAASYTDSEADLPGQVINPVMVVGRHSRYLLTCYYDTDTQAHATSAWVARFSKDVAYIRRSIHIPKNER